MTNQPNCPQCKSEYTYEDRGLWVCSACAHEWKQGEQKNTEEETSGFMVKDANGNLLKEGDSVTVIKDLKVKGSSSAIKVGTKVRNIRLVDGPDGHNISCKIDGFGAMNLKSEFVRKI
jgi:protein PhnA